MKGYNGTSVKDLTDAAGVPKGSFYTYFQDKEHYKDFTVKERFSILDDKSSNSLDHIRNFYIYVIETFKTRDNILGCFAGNLSEEMGEPSEIIKNALDNFHKKGVNKIYFNLTEAKENNELSSDIDLKILAGFIVSSWQGSMLRAKVSSNNNILDNFIYILDTVLLT